MNCTALSTARPRRQGGQIANSLKQELPSLHHNLGAIFVMTRIATYNGVQLVQEFLTSLPQCFILLPDTEQSTE